VNFYPSNGMGAVSPPTDPTTKGDPSADGGGAGAGCGSPLDTVIAAIGIPPWFVLAIVPFGVVAIPLLALGIGTYVGAKGK
jgi:hypothetical protein